MEEMLSESGLVAEINALELAAFEAEGESSDTRWLQAEKVASALDAGETTRSLAAQWMNPETGQPYGKTHVVYVAKTWRALGHLGDRPRWNTAYHSDEVRKKDGDTVVLLPPPPLPDGEFRTITADPPWRYDNKATRGAAEDHYGTMSMDELFALQIPSADDAHLYLWVTNGMLREGLDLCAAWGFTYKTMLTWCKPQIGLGNYFRNSTEHVLFGLKGKLPTLAADIPTWFVADRTRHSAKPDSFHDLVERASPGPYLEMFARRQRLGWNTWGNEALEHIAA